MWWDSFEGISERLRCDAVWCMGSMSNEHGLKLVKRLQVMFVCSGMTISYELYAELVATVTRWNASWLEFVMCWSIFYWNWILELLWESKSIVCPMCPASCLVPIPSWDRFIEQLFLIVIRLQPAGSSSPLLDSWRWYQCLQITMALNAMWLGTSVPYDADLQDIYDSGCQYVWQGSYKNLHISSHISSRKNRGE